MAVSLSVSLGLGLGWAASAGTVWDDAIGWYRGGVDKNSDGKFAAGELFDNRHPTSTGTSQSAVATGGGSGDIWFRTGVDVFSPMMNRTIAGQQCIDLAQTVTYDEQGGGTAKLGMIGLPRIITDDTYSAIIRFKPADDVVSTVASFLLNFGCRWASSCGVMVGFQYVTPETSRLYCLVGGNIYWPDTSTWRSGDTGAIYGETLTIENGKWTEMSVVVNGKTIRIGVTQEGAPTQWRSLNLETAWYSPGTHSFVPYDGNADGVGGYARITVGGEAPDWNTFTVTPNASKKSEKYPNGYPDLVASGGNAKVFRGMVHEIAFWDRALTDDEVREAFAAPTPNLVRYGVPGLTATLFSNGATSVSDSVVVNPLTKQDFRDCRYKLASGGKLGVQFNVPERIAGLEQIVFVKAAADSAAAWLSVRLDGKELRSLSVAADGAAHCAIEKGALTSGDHLLELVREDSVEGAFVLDHLTVGGSFQMGAEDSEYGEMSAPDKAPSTTTFAIGNPKEWAYSIYGPPSNASARKLTMRFALPEGFSTSTHKLRYTFKTQLNDISKHTVISLNGKVVKSMKHGEDGYQNNTVQKVFLRGDDLVAGENVLEWSVPDDSPTLYWAMFNYHRIECCERKGLLLVVE